MCYPCKEGRPASVGVLDTSGIVADWMVRLSITTCLGLDGGYGRVYSPLDGNPGAYGIQTLSTAAAIQERGWGSVAAAGISSRGQLGTDSASKRIRGGDSIGVRRLGHSPRFASASIVHLAVGQQRRGWWSLRESATARRGAGAVLAKDAL